MSKQNSSQSVSTLSQLKEVAGLFTCLLEHKVVKTTAQFKWEGPKIPVEEWDKVMAFFQWSYDTTKSETQVRGYVNVNLNTWKFWAYPQEANLGLSAREMENAEETKTQRAQFNPDDGWRYFLTAHHHCSAGAFQSGTDRANEQGQDGLHITVGSMDASTHTLHERFYLCGNLIPHDLSWFWDIGEVMKPVPPWAAKLLPDDIKDRIARGQMCEKSPPNTAFPEQWKQNLIYKKVELPVHYQGGLGYNPSQQVSSHIFQRKHTNSLFDLKQARSQLTKLCEASQLDEVETVIEMQHILKEDKFLVELINLMYRNDVSLDKFAEFVEADIISERTDTSHEVQKQIAEGNGIPDYEGSAYGHLPE